MASRCVQSTESTPVFSVAYASSGVDECWLIQKDRIKKMTSAIRHPLQNFFGFFDVCPSVSDLEVFCVFPLVEEVPVSDDCSLCDSVTFSLLRYPLDAEKKK